MADWAKNKKWLQNWIPVIAEGLGALAILAAAGTYVFRAFAPDRIEISASVLASRSNGLSLFITNSGGVDLALKQASIYIAGLDRDELIRLTEGELLVPHGTSKIVVSGVTDLSSAVAYDPAVDDALRTSVSKCTITLRFASANGKPVPPTKVPLDCIRASVKRE